MYVILAFTLMTTFAYGYMKSKFCENVEEFHCWLAFVWDLCLFLDSVITVGVSVFGYRVPVLIFCFE